MRNYEDLKMKILLPASPFLLHNSNNNNNNNNDNRTNDKLDIVVYQESLIQSQLIGRDENIVNAVYNNNNSNEQNNR